MEKKITVIFEKIIRGRKRLSAQELPGAKSKEIFLRNPRTLDGAITRAISRKITGDVPERMPEEIIVETT